MLSKPLDKVVAQKTSEKALADKDAKIAKIKNILKIGELKKPPPSKIRMMKFKKNPNLPRISRVRRLIIEAGQRKERSQRNYGGLEAYL